MADLAQLGIRIDATEVTPAAAKLDVLTAAGARAEAQTDKVTAATVKQSGSQAALAARASALLNASGAITQAQTTYNAAIAEATELYNANAISAVERASVVMSAEKALADAVVASDAKQVAANEAVVVSSMEMRHGLSAIKEAGEGNFGGLSISLMRIAASMGLTTIAFIGTAVAIAAVVAAFAFFEIAGARAAEATRKLDAEISGVGRMSGVTAQQIDDASKKTAAAQNISIGSAQELAETYAKTGKIAGDVLIGLTGITEKYADATGNDAKKAAEELASLFSDPAEGAKKLNAELGFLNVTQLARIKQLADEGDRMGAQKALYAALDTAIDTTAQVHVHGLIAAWQDVTTWAGNAYHAMTIAAGGGSGMEQLVKLKQDLADAKAGQQGGKDFGTVDPYEVAAAQKAVDDLTASMAKQDTQNKKNVESGIAITATQNAYAKAVAANPELAVLDDLITARKSYNAALDVHTQAILKDSPATLAAITHERDATVDAIKRVTDATGNYIPQAVRDDQIAKLQAQSAGTLNNVKKGQLETQIKLLQAGSSLVTNQEALTKATDAGAIVAAKADTQNKGAIQSAQQQLAAAKLQLEAQNKLNTSFANGTMTTAELAKQEKLDAELKDIQAKAATITGEAHTKLIAIIKELKPVLSSLYDSDLQGELVKQNTASQDANDILQKQIDLAGQSSDTRDVEIAQYKELLTLKAQGGDGLANSAAGLNAIAIAGRNATLALNNTMAALKNVNEGEGQSLGTNAGRATMASDPSNYVKQQAVAYAQIDKLRKLDVLNETQAAQAKGIVDAEINAQRFKNASDFFGNLATLSTSKNKALAMVGKAAAITQATIDGVVAVQKALAAYPPPTNYIMAAGVGVAAAANVAKIAGLKDGGPVVGPGGPRDDRVLLWGSNGEYMVNAAATARNRPLLDAINSGQTVQASDNSAGSASTANPGTVTPLAASSARPVVGPSRGVNVEFHNHGTSKQFEVQQLSESDVRIIARDEIHTRTPGIMATETGKANSPFRRQMSQHLEVKRRL